MLNEFLLTTFKKIVETFRQIWNFHLFYRAICFYGLIFDISHEQGTSWLIFEYDNAGVFHNVIRLYLLTVMLADD